MTAPPVGAEIDARYFEPPEPFVRTQAALATLGPNQSLRLLLFREPHPLFAALREQGWQYRCRLEADGTFEILIWR